jgi:hypothetical protein
VNNVVVGPIVALIPTDKGRKVVVLFRVLLVGLVIFVVGVGVGVAVVAIRLGILGQRASPGRFHGHPRTKALQLTGPMRVGSYEILDRVFIGS